jgi:DNA-binding NtrC family response regulator
MHLKLLIIHPDDLFRRHLAERLEIALSGIAEAATEAEAREIVVRRDFDVVLSGLPGPLAGRLALLAMIKELRPLTEVILLSGEEEQSLESSIQAMQLGAFDDLPVPLEIGVLQGRIREAARRRRARLKTRRRALSEGPPSGRPPEGRTAGGVASAGANPYKESR